METMTDQAVHKQNVHAVMTPMSQPVGGWHVTSMTRQPRLVTINHDQAKTTIE